MNWKRIRKKACGLSALALLVLCTGCGAGGPEEGKETSSAAREDIGAGMEQTAGAEMAAEEDGPEDAGQGTGILGESAADNDVDFDMLREKNPDIFAWLYIPGTDIDLPIVQSPVSDEYYRTRNVLGEEDGSGAVYTEMPNLMDMCDFNTVIHGNDLEEGAPFRELHLFEDADFFDGHEEFYIYLPDNVLTYEIFVAYYDEESDILRRYDYTTYEGCLAHLNDIYGLRSMNRNFREDWEGLTPYHFLVTLDGCVREDGTQYVVIGALTKDAAGKIDRMVLE